MALAELVQKVLRPLDRARDELREKHHVESVDAEVTLGSLPALVHFDRVRHRLERVKRQADWEDYREERKVVRPVKHLRYRVRVGTEEVEVLEDSEHSDVRNDARDEPGLSFPALRVLDDYAGHIVDRDREKQDQDVDRDERHVEVAA